MKTRLCAHRADPVVLLVAGVAIAVGSMTGARGTTQDVDQRVFESVIVHMRGGYGYYDGFAEALREKSGVGPSQVRSVRTPVVSMLLAPFPRAAWRWLAAIPAFAICLTSAALAGPHLLARRLAAGLAGLWMVTSLPLLYLHAELWGAPLVLGAALLLRRSGALAATLAAIAAVTRELYVLPLVVGLALARRRRPWLVALLLVAIAGLFHAVWATRLLDPHGFEPPIGARERVSIYVGPGSTVPGELTGMALLGAASVGCVMRRADPAFRFLIGGLAPLIVATALSGRSYWSLTWSGMTSAAAGVAIAAGIDRVRGASRGLAARSAPYPRT